jgi:hypothetical protein
LIDAAAHIALIAIELERLQLALKNALVEIRNSEHRLRTIIDTIPALAWSARPDGSAEFFNRRWNERYIQMKGTYKAVEIAGNGSPRFQSTESMVVYSGAPRAKPESSIT